MGKASKILNFLKSLLMIVIGLAIMEMPIESSHVIAAVVLGFLVTYKGLKNFIFYLASARHMIGGGKILINSLILMNFGILSFLVLFKSLLFATVYLVSIFVVIGVIDILRAFEIRKNQSKGWRLQLLKGILLVLVSIATIILIAIDRDSADQDSLAILMFSIVWIVQGVSGIVKTFRKTSVAYVDTTFESYEE